MDSRGQRMPSRPPNVNIIDLTFDDNPPPTKKKGKLIQIPDSETYARCDAPVREKKPSNSDDMKQEVSVTREPSESHQHSYEAPPTSSELMSYALRMNSHQIAKELLLDEEDVKWVQSTSSFLTGNTDLLNAGSLRRELSAEALFLKAVEEVERARARIIHSATKQPQESAGTVVPPVVEREISVAESEEYSEKYDSDFSADSIDVDSDQQKELQSPEQCKEEEGNSSGSDRSSLLQRAPSCRDHRLISDMTDMTEDYEDDYHSPDSDSEPDEVGGAGRHRSNSNSNGNHRSSMPGSRGDLKEHKQWDAKDTDACTGSTENSVEEKGDGESEHAGSGEGGTAVFDLLSDLMDQDSDSEQRGDSSDEEHEKSILKRLNEAHEQRSSPSRLSRHATPTTNYFSSPLQARELAAKQGPGNLRTSHKQVLLPSSASLLLADDLTDLAALELDPDHEQEREMELEHGEYSVQYSQLKSNDSSCRNHFSVGNSSSSSSSSSNNKSFSAHHTDNSRYSKFSASTQSSSSSRGGNGVVDPLSLSLSRVGTGPSTRTCNTDQGGTETETETEAEGLPLPTPGRLSENNNMDIMIAGGLNEWLVMNMKENTSIALQSLNKRVDNHHILHSSSSSTPPHCTKQLSARFSVCAEVYQHYLAEAVQLHEQYDEEVRVRSLAHAFTGNILQQVGGQLQHSDDRDRDRDSDRDMDRDSDSEGNDRTSGAGGDATPLCTPPPKRRHSAKAKDDFDLLTGVAGGGGWYVGEHDDAAALLQSDPKGMRRFYRQHSVGQKLTSASVQIECVSKLEGGRRSPLSCGGTHDKEEQSKAREDEEVEDEDEDKASSHADSKQPADGRDVLSQAQAQVRNNNEDSRASAGTSTAAERIRLSQSFEQKKNEIRRKNRRALFAAMHLGDIAGRLVMERSQSSSSLI